MMLELEGKSNWIGGITDWNALFIDLNQSFKIYLYNYIRVLQTVYNNIYFQAAFKLCLVKLKIWSESSTKTLFVYIYFLTSVKVKEPFVWFTTIHL